MIRSARLDRFLNPKDRWIRRLILMLFASTLALLIPFPVTILAAVLYLIMYYAMDVLLLKAMNIEKVLRD